MKYIQERTVIIAGVILVLLPFSGFPRGWKMWITGLVGLVLIFVGTLQKAKARAEELRNMKDAQDVVDFERFEAELERSLTRVKIADKWKGKKYRAIKI